MFFDIELLFVIVKFNLKQFYIMNQNYLSVIYLISFALLLTIPLVIMWRSFQRKKQQKMFDEAIPYSELPKGIKYRSLGYRTSIDGKQSYMLIQEKENPKSKRCIIVPNETNERIKLSKSIPTIL